MSDKNKTLAYVLLASAAGLGIYALTSGSGSGSGSGNNYHVPAGGTLNTNGATWTNNTGAPVWATATGLIFNAAGTLLGNITDLIAALGPGGNDNPDNGNGTYETGIGWPSGNYYNPLPGGLM